jgi:hypothetical protein
MKPQHAPKTPHEDPKFLQSTPARPLRILAEYTHPLVQLKKEGIGDTIVMFGSARIEAHETAQARYTRLKKEKTSKLSSADYGKHTAALRQAKSALEMSRYYEEARALSHKITSWALTLGPKPRRFVICSGGGPGIMEAANRGAFDAGAKSIGLNITLPHEQYPNPYITPDLCFRFHYFALRKLHFLLRAKALVAFPGGYGTFDELFETLTLVQTRKIKPVPVVLVGESYWRQAFNVDFLVAEGVIDAEDRELFWFAETAHDIWEGILEWYERAGEPLL